MTRHYPDLGSASDWVKHLFSLAARPVRSTYPDLGSDALSVWNICARFSVFISRRNSAAVADSYPVAIQYVYLGWEKTNPNLLSPQIHINSDWVRVASRNVGCFLNLTLSYIFKLCKQAITSAPLTQILVKLGLNGLRESTPLQCIISNYLMSLSMIWKNYAGRAEEGVMPRQIL